MLSKQLFADPPKTVSTHTKRITNGWKQQSGLCSVLCLPCWTLRYWYILICVKRATGGLKEGLLHSCLSIPHTLITPRSSVRAVCSLQYDEENGSDITLRRSVKYRLNLCPCVFGRVKGVLRSRVRIRVNAIFWLISCEWLAIKILKSRPISQFGHISWLVAFKFS